MLLEYHLLDEHDFSEIIKEELEKKFNAMVDCDLYTQYKTAPTEEERNRVRNAYLDRKGYFSDWSW
jgi:hypothetical protein